MESKRDEGRGEGGHEFGPLPGGHHTLTRRQIADSQRERLLAAMAAEVAAVGYREVRLRSLTTRAGVSSRDFYEHFEDKEACFLATFEAVRVYLEERIAEAVAAEPDWPHQVLAVLRIALEFFEAEPDLARLCLVEAMNATPAIAVHFRAVVLGYVPALARGRDLLDDPDSLPPSTEDSIIAGAISLAKRQIVLGESEGPAALLPDLVEFLLSPYLGAERAAAFAALPGASGQGDS